MVEIEIPGAIPSKKNSRNLFTRNGRIVNIPNKRYADWHKNSSIFLIGQSKPNPPISEVILMFYLPDHRKRDLTNMAESIMDLLCDAKFIEDDNYTVIPKLTLFAAGFDKDKPRCEIKIYDSRHG